MNAGLKFGLLTLPIAVLGAAYLAYTISTRPPPEQEVLAERARHVSVVEARTRSVRPVLKGFGRVEPARVFAAISEVPGTAVYVNPELHRGEILPAGALLVRLSEAEFSLAVARSRSALRSAESRLAELEVAEANYRASLAIEQQTLQLREADLARAERLFAAGSVPQTNRDAALATALAQRQKVQSLESSLALLPSQRAVQSEQIVASRIGLEQAELDLARTELTLPYAARVSMVAVETGQFVRAGSTVAELDGIDAAEVEAQMDLAGLRRMMQLTGGDTGTMPLDPAVMTETIRRMDLEARVTLALGEETVGWDASLDRLSDTIDPRTGDVGVIVRVEHAYESARPGARPPLTQGMFVEVTLQAPPLEGLVLPRTALRDGAVFVADGQDRMRRVPISPRLVQGDIILVTEGLAEGARVLVTPPRPAIEGMLLVPHPGTSPALEATGDGAAR
jgi:multidrug efflux pump subunit AcrA (membrane-fusion protein)